MTILSILTGSMNGPGTSQITETKVEHFMQTQIKI